MKSKIHFAAAALAALLAVVSGCVADHSHDLLERHIAWRGGRANLQGLRDITTRGKMHVATLAGDLVVMERRDGYRKVEYEIAGQKGREYLTPEGGWELNHSGQMDAMDRVRAAQGRRQIEGDFMETLLAGRAKHIGTEEREGRSWEVYRIGNDDDHTDLFIDPADGSLTWERTIKNGEEQWEHLEDWRVVDGVRMSFSNTILKGGKQPDTMITWEEILLNRGLQPTDFAVTDERKIVQFASSDADWMPLTLYQDRYIYLPCRVNGVETELLLDSGAGITVLDKSFADQIEIKGEGALTARGTAKTQQASLAKGVNIELGAMKLKDLTVAIIDLSELVKRFNRPMPVILGKELFNSTVVEIDYPGRRVRFHDAAAFAYQENGHSLEMHPTENGKRLIEMSVEGRAPALFQIDTGSGACLDIFDAYTQEQKLLEGRERVSTAYMGGVGGQAVEQIATLKSLDFAGYRLKNVPTGFAPPGPGAFGTTAYAGNLGAGVFTRFKVIFDFTRNRLHVEPGPQWDTAPYDKNRLGLAAEYADGKLKIVHVATGSPAEKAGIKIDDLIEQVNGAAISEDSWAIDLKQASRAAAGTKVTLKLADGRELSVALAEYY